MPWRSVLTRTGLLSGPGSVLYQRSWMWPAMGGHAPLRSGRCDGVGRQGGVLPGCVSGVLAGSAGVSPWPPCLPTRGFFAGQPREAGLGRQLGSSPCLPSCLPTPRPVAEANSKRSGERPERWSVPGAVAPGGRGAGARVSWLRAVRPGAGAICYRAGGDRCGLLAGVLPVAPAGATGSGGFRRLVGSVR